MELFTWSGGASWHFRGRLPFTAAMMNEQVVIGGKYLDVLDAQTCRLHA